MKMVKILCCLLCTSLYEHDAGGEKNWQNFHDCTFMYEVRIAAITVCLVVVVFSVFLVRAPMKY